MLSNFEPKIDGKYKSDGTIQSYQSVLTTILIWVLKCLVFCKFHVEVL